MILLHPFPNGELRNEIIRTTMNTVRAEATEDEEIGAIAVFRFYTVAVIPDKRENKKT